MNFENSNLLGGWDVNKEAHNYGVILQDPSNKQFLAIVSKDSSQIFEKTLSSGRGKNKQITTNPLYEAIGTDVYRKMEYNYWSDVSRMIPKCSTQLKDVIAHFGKTGDDFIFPVGYKVTSGERFTEECRISKEVFELNNRVYKKDNPAINKLRSELTTNEEKQYVKEFQKEFYKASGDTAIYREALAKWINFCKYFLSKYPKTKLFQYRFRETGAYDSVDEFYRDVDIYSYKLDLDTVVNKAQIDQLVELGRIYLFEIKNQDSNDGKESGHRNNLHTMYWRAIFQDIKNRPILNGGAEVFYRKAIPVDKLETIENKKTRDGNVVIKNYRFSKERFILHVPITLNFCLNDNNLNLLTNNNFSNYPDIRFLGIDRGEKHLGYYSLVDAQGNIRAQGTLNMPFQDKDGNPRSIRAKKRFLDEKGKEQEVEVECKDYNDLLAARAGDRDYARKNWQTIGTIKELKEGYISQVVHQIAEIATGQPTFIVLEDLNTGFMRGRQKIEKSVYKKFEVALLKKLNFLVDKSKDSKYDELGSVTKALQLTPLAKNYDELKDKGKQAGVMLFVRPDYTSQTDPVTGWRKKIYIGAGSESTIRDAVIKRFSDIYFDGKDYVFKYEDAGTGRPWRMYSGKDGKSLDRFHRERGDKGEWIATAQNLPEMLSKLFANFSKEDSLLEQIKAGKNLEKINQHTAWESLRFVISLLQQIRNTGKNGVDRDADFILSPVRDDNGNHFDSRMYWDKEQRHETANLPSSGDANGAYNIARKGAILNEHIKRSLSLYVRDEEWDAWWAGRNTWERWLQANEKQLRKNKKV